jgi:hypothetical protein
VTDPLVIFDMRMGDGSRHFGGFPEKGGEVADWELLSAAVATLPGAVLTGFVTDHVTEAWIDFTFAGESFSWNNQHGQWWGFVTRPECPDALMLQVLVHFAAALQWPMNYLLQGEALAAGTFRVLVREVDGRVRLRDFPDRAAAVRHADDCASEGDPGPAQAWVHDHSLQCVHIGRHYGASS